MLPNILPDKKVIAQIIHDARKKADLTQAELAKMIGMSDKHISKLETGLHYPALDTFLKVLTALHLTLGDFGIFNTPENSSSKEYILNITESLSEKQLDICADLIKACIKHI